MQTIKYKTGDIGACKSTLDVCVVLVFQKNIVHVVIDIREFVDIYSAPSLCRSVTKGTYMGRKLTFETTKLRARRTIR